MHPERIHNLYFAYLFVMRAISKAGPELMEYDYNTGRSTIGASPSRTRRGMRMPPLPLVLLCLTHACLLPYARQGTRATTSWCGRR
jgi:hypothetical protein